MNNVGFKVECKNNGCNYIKMDGIGDEKLNLVQWLI